MATISRDFDGGNYIPSLTTVTDDGSHVELVVTAHTTYGSRIRHYGVRLSGVQGKTLTVRVQRANTFDDASRTDYWRGCWGTDPDGDVWNKFDSTTRDSGAGDNGEYVLTLGTPLTADTVYLHHMPWHSTGRMAALTAAWCQDGRVTSLGDADGVIETTPTATDVVGRATPPQPMLGFKLGTGPLQFALGSRLHCDEAPGGYMLEGAVDWLLGGSAEANAALAAATYLVYPLLMPRSVYAGYSRDDYDSLIDANRMWNEPAGTSWEMDRWKALIPQHTGGLCHGLLDYHSYPSSSSASETFINLDRTKFGLNPEWLEEYEKLATIHVIAAGDGPERFRGWLHATHPDAEVGLAVEWGHLERDGQDDWREQGELSVRALDGVRRAGHFPNAGGARVPRMPTLVAYNAGDPGPDPDPPANRPPVAGFTLSTVNLRATASSSATDPDGDALTISYEWGDGVTSAGPAHTYAEAGTYTVRQRVSDPSGASATAVQNVTVEALPPLDKPAKTTDLEWSADAATVQAPLPAAPDRTFDLSFRASALQAPPRSTNLSHTQDERIYVEDLEEIGPIPVFSELDTILLSYVNRDSGMTVAEVWGQVSDYRSEGDGIQSWAWATIQSTAPPGAIIHRGAVAIDFGKPGDGLHKATVLDGNAGGYLQGERWFDDDQNGVPDRRDLAYRIGDLSGISREGIGQLEGEGIFTDRGIFYLDKNNYIRTDPFEVVIAGRRALTATADGKLFLGDEAVVIEQDEVGIHVLTRFAPPDVLGSATGNPDAWGQSNDNLILEPGNVTRDTQHGGVRFGQGEHSTRQAVPYTGAELLAEGAVPYMDSDTDIEVFIDFMDAVYLTLSSVSIHRVDREQGTDGGTFSTPVPAHPTASFYRVRVLTLDGDLTLSKLRVQARTELGALGETIIDNGRIRTDRIDVQNVVNAARVVAKVLDAADGTVGTLRLLESIFFGPEGTPSNLELDGPGGRIVLYDPVTREPFTIGTNDFDASEDKPAATSPEPIAALNGQTVATADYPADQGPNGRRFERVVTATRSGVYTIRGVNQVELRSDWRGSADAEARVVVEVYDSFNTLLRRETKRSGQSLQAVAFELQLNVPTGGFLRVQVVRETTARATLPPDNADRGERSTATATATTSGLQLTVQGVDAEFASHKGINYRDSAGNRSFMQREGGEMGAEIVHVGRFRLIDNDGTLMKSYDGGAWSAV